MSIRQLLMTEHSRSASNSILAMIQKDPGRVYELMECFFDVDNRLCQRAAWPVVELSEKHTKMLIPFMARMIQNLEKPSHNAIVRNTVRIWQFLNIPEEFQGHVFDICYKFLVDPKAATAIRAFSMTVCANICNFVPELKEELALAIEEHIELGSSGFVHRGMKTITMLRK